MNIKDKLIQIQYTSPQTIQTPILTWALHQALASQIPRNLLGWILHYWRFVLRQLLQAEVSMDTSMAQSSNLQIHTLQNDKHSAYNWNKSITHWYPNHAMESSISISWRMEPMRCIHSKHHIVKCCWPWWIGYWYQWNSCTNVEVPYWQVQGQVSHQGYQYLRALNSLMIWTKCAHFRKTANNEGADIKDTAYHTILVSPIMYFTIIRHKI